MPPDNQALWYDYETETEAKRRFPYWRRTALIMVFTLSVLYCFV
jgi:hypothetical protein